MGLGVDVLCAGELDRLLRRAWFRRYVYADAEVAVAESFGTPRAREFLAGRFAAKEAIAKAIGTRFRAGIQPRQLAVLHAASGAPEVELTGAAARHAEQRGVERISVSITHKGELVVAVALAGDGTGGPVAERAACEVAETVLAKTCPKR
jgi:holo-[acyl-carrier protein] synthase